VGKRAKKTRHSETQARKRTASGRSKGASPKVRAKKPAGAKKGASKRTRKTTRNRSEKAEQRRPKQATRSRSEKGSPKPKSSAAAKGASRKGWSAEKYGDAAERAEARGDHRGAIEISLAGFAAHPDRFEFQHNIALRYEFDLDDPVAAEPHYRKALELDPDIEESLCNLSGILLERGAIAEAEKLLTDALGRVRTHASLHYNLACLRARQGDSDRALEALAEAIRLEPKDRRKEAKADPDFKALKSDPRFKALLENRDVPPNPFPSYLPRRLTTPPPPLAIAQRYPELHDRVRTCVRLHPRDRGPLPLRSSRLGGRFLNNQPKSWPACPDHRAPCVGVLQLLSEDIPGLDLPEGKCAVQVLWCPRDHGDVDYAPKVMVRFLAPAELTDPQGDNPAVRDAEDHYVPQECALFPEVIEEYPDSREFEYEDGAVGRDLVRKMEADPDLLGLVARIEDEPGDYGDGAVAYRYFLSTAPGTKLGGHPGWAQDPEVRDCPECSKPMEHYLTVDSTEWSGTEERVPRWKPIESGPDQQNDADLTIGRGGSLYVFVCKRHGVWPMAQVSQS
jgi:tetratricopeptide (TPR) repeat protein